MRWCRKQAEDVGRVDQSGLRWAPAFHDPIDTCHEQDVLHRLPCMLFLKQPADLCRMPQNLFISYRQAGKERCQRLLTCSTMPWSSSITRWVRGGR